MWSVFRGECDEECGREKWVQGCVAVVERRQRRERDGIDAWSLHQCASVQQHGKEVCSAATKAPFLKQAAVPHKKEHVEEKV